MPFRELTLNRASLIGIGVDVTEKCNRKCKTCFANASPRDMHPRVFGKIVDEGAQFGFSELYVLGGEPGLRRDLLNLLRYGTKKFELVILVTNADFLADEGVCREVAATGVVIAAQRHTIFNDATARHLEQSLCGVDCLSTSNLGWENIQKYFPPSRVCVQCCITAPVVETSNIFEVFRWARRLGYEPVMEFTKEGHEFTRGCILDVSPAEMHRVFREFQRIDREEFGLPGAELLSPQAYGKTCHMQETSIHFKVDGEAVSCVGFPGLSYGNIMTDSMEGILAHPLRQLIKNPSEWIFGYCRDECPHFEQCTGGCRGSSFDMTGCYRASFYYCPNIPRERLKLSDMIPPSCRGCPIDGHPSCHPQRA